jgi:flagellar protein FliO/FliZ
MIRSLLASAALLCSLPPAAALAQVADDSPALRPPPGAPDLLGVATSLVLVVGAIFLIGWLYTRAQGLRGGGGGAIRIIAAQPLGARERIVVVDVAGKQLVVGVTSSNINTLHAFDSPVVEAATPAIGGAFASRLRAALGSRTP